MRDHSSKTHGNIWFRFGPSFTLAALSVFVFASLWAKWNPVQAQDPAKGKEAAKQKKVTPKSQKPASNLGVIPGAGQKLDALALSKIIDDQVNKKLLSEEIKASGKSADTEFLRRVYLDLIGVIPPPEKVREFLDNTDAEKRRKVIDDLLADPRFGKALAENWAGLMVPRESNNRLLKSTPLHEWLASAFHEGKPLDKIVYELLTATGTQEENGAVTFFIGNPTVDKMTDNVSRMFLGLQLQCAQCHNHPFVEWKQNDYWGMAGFFRKVKLSANPQQAAKKGVSPGITESAGGKGGKKMPLPESVKNVPAKFLMGEQPKLKDGEPNRPVLAKWLTAVENPYFARAMVNRFWYQLFGRGIVNPVDDMHDDNAPTHGELLAALTEQFKTNGFDVKYLLRAICNSEAYQRTSRPEAENGSDTEFYSHRVVRVLSPEQLFDSLVRVLGLPGGRKGDVAPIAKKGPIGSPRDAFLNFFRIDEGANPLEYQAGIPQALRLMNAGGLNNTLPAVVAAMKDAKGPEQVIERLFFVALSRPPTGEETRRMLTHAQREGDSRGGYSDILWALLNSSEFALNH
ncbi:MAG: DUF1549 domain-containing protein [Planctomycetes bacterium]|nr:DUF1549 domain-containing protein [Planctomycetota bacterium]